MGAADADGFAVSLVDAVLQRVDVDRGQYRHLPRGYGDGRRGAASVVLARSALGGGACGDCSRVENGEQPQRRASPTYLTDSLICRTNTTYKLSLTNWCRHCGWDIMRSERMAKSWTILRRSLTLLLKSILPQVENHKLARVVPASLTLRHI